MYDANNRELVPPPRAEEVLKLWSQNSQEELSYSIDVRQCRIRSERKFEQHLRFYTIRINNRLIEFRQQKAYAIYILVRLYQVSRAENTAIELSHGSLIEGGDLNVSTWSWARPEQLFSPQYHVALSTAVATGQQLIFFKYNVCR